MGGGIDDLARVDLGTIKISKGENGQLAWRRLKLYNNTTKRVGEKENIFVIDLASKMPKSSLFYYDGIHYTNEGAEKVSDILCEELKEYFKSHYEI